MNKIVAFLVFTSFIGLLSACQLVPGAGTMPPSPDQVPPTQSPGNSPTQPSATALPITPTPSTEALAGEVPSTATPTLVATQNQTAPASQAVKEYFAALQSGDAARAARLTSSYSLMMDNLTQSDWASVLQGQMAQGDKWSDLEVKGARVFDDHTVLVHVAYQLATKDRKTGASAESSRDELWPARLENGEWMYNRENLIDFRDLSIPYQTTAGLVIQPLRLVRFSDHLSMVFLAQNRTDQPIVLGQSSEILATFYFGQQKVQAEQTRLFFDSLRSYPDASIDLQGLFTSYPDGVEIRRWKNVSEKPWFVFNFTHE